LDPVGLVLELVGPAVVPAWAVDRVVDPEA